MNTDTTPDTREDHQKQEEERSRRRRRFESFMIKARAEEAQKEQRKELENTQREREAWDETMANIQRMNYEFDR